MKIAIISDIHGNSWALSAVLADIKGKGISSILNLGDSLYGPLDPQGTFDMLISHEILSISGNEDRLILEKLNTKSDSATLEFVKEHLDKNAIDWLKALKPWLVYKKKIFGCHGVPANDTQYLLERISGDFVTVRSGREIDLILNEIDYSIVICGHSHVQGIIRTESKLVINPGSVGCPAFDDDFPVYHKMENHHNQAQYCVVELNGRNPKVEKVRVPYDYQKAAKTAILNQRPDWAKWIVTGKV